MTNRFSVRVAVVVGVAVDLRLRLGGHGGVDEVKVVLVPMRDLVGYGGNLCAQLHALRGCFTSPGVATPSYGALWQHPHTLQSPDVGDHYGSGVRPPIMASGSGTP